MNTADVLRRSVEHTHQNLAARLEGARTTAPTLAQPRKPYEDIDTFLAMASKHLGAVDAVLLPAVRKNVREHGHLVHDYVHAEKELEIALAHVKARAYGSTYEAGHAWQEVWSDVDATLSGHRRAELALAGALTLLLLMTAARADAPFSLYTTPGQLPKAAVPVHYTLDLQPNLEALTHIVIDRDR